MKPWIVVFIVAAVAFSAGVASASDGGSASRIGVFEVSVGYGRNDDETDGGNGYNIGTDAVLYFPHEEDSHFRIGFRPEFNYQSVEIFGITAKSINLTGNLQLEAAGVWENVDLYLYGGGGWFNLDYAIADESGGAIQFGAGGRYSFTEQFYFFSHVAVLRNFVGNDTALRLVNVSGGLGTAF